MPNASDYKNLQKFGTSSDGFTEALSQFMSDNGGKKPSKGDLNKLYSFYLGGDNSGDSKDKGDDKGDTTWKDTILGVGKDFVSSQVTQGAFTSSGKDYAISGILDTLVDTKTSAAQKLEALFKQAMKGITDQLKEESELRNDINSKTTLSGELSKKLRQDIVESSIAAARYGLNMKDLGDIFTNLVNQSGKFNLINQDTFEKAAPTIRAFLDSAAALGQTMAEFEKVGVGTNKTIDLINVAGTKSIGLGLSGKKVVADITTNIGKLNEYGFSKGVEGLTRMVQKSLEFKMNLESVFSVADKVMNPEGALDLVANLQVLGGAIGDLGDPLRLMYDATNNVEGIQDALIGAAGSLATYSREQGRFEITGLNLRRAKEMAQQLGISYQELAKGAISAAERSSAASAIMRSGLQMSDEDKEFLTNLSHMEGGQMVISIPKSLADQLGKPTQMALDQLDATTAKSVLEFQKEMSKMSPQDIARDQLMEIEAMGRDLQVLVTLAKIRAIEVGGKVGKAISEVIPIDKAYELLKNTIKQGADWASGTNQGNQTTNTLNNQILNSIDNSLKTSTSVVVSQNNPGNQKIKITGVYPEGVDGLSQATLKGNEPVIGAVSTNVEQTKNLNENYKQTVIQTKDLVDNQKQTTDSIKNVSTSFVTSDKNVQDNLSKDNVVLDILKKQTTDLTKNDLTNVVTSGKNVQEKLTNENVNTNVVLDTLKKQSTEVFNKSGVMEDLTKTIKTNNLNTTVNNNIDTSTAFKQLFTKEGRDEYVTKYEKGRTDFSDVSNKTENVKNFVQTINSPMEGNPNPINLFNPPTLLAKTEPVTNTINPNINTTIENKPITGDVTKTENKPSTMVIEHKMSINSGPSVVDPIARAIFNNPEYTFDNVPDYLKNPKISQYS